MEKTGISAAGFFSAVYLSALVGVFMYMSNTESAVGSSDSVIRPLIFAVFNAVLMIPALFYIKCIGKKSSLVFLNENFRGASVFFSAAYCITFLMGLISTASRFDLFASSVMFYQTDMSFFTAAILAVCAVISLLGIGAITRGGIVFCVIVVLGTLGAVVTGLINEFDVLNFTPLFNESASQFFSDRFGFSIFCNELSAIFVLLPKICGNIKKSYFVWLFITAVTMSVLGFCVVGELGAFADTQLFPVYAVSTVSGVGVFDRFDAIETAVWMLCVVLRLSFQLAVFHECFNSLFNTHFKYLPTFLGAAVSGCVTVWVSHNIKRYAFLSSDAFFAVPFLVTAVLQPSVCLIINSAKRKKGKTLENAC